MFIKTTRVKNYEYIKLVESYWEAGRPHHRVLYNFGRIDNIKKDASFVKADKRLCEILEISAVSTGRAETGSIFDSCGEAELYNYGYLAYLRLWKKLKIEDTLKALQKGCSRATYPIHEAAFLMAVQHLLEPMSKLSAYEHQKRYFNLNEIPLQHMYRTLEKLSEWKEDLEYDLFKYNYLRTKQKVDVVFYDVTTFAFESVSADGLREFGFSKDCKFNEVQIVMGMIIDGDGIPVGYELFSGNTFDGKTMTEALKNIRKRFGIERVIIVADRGLNMKDNLRLIKEAGYGYIMSSRIKGMSAAKQKEILAPEGFAAVNDANGDEEFRYKVMEYANAYTDEEGGKHSLDENLIISYSPKRALKDRRDRDRLVEKARELLKHPEKITAMNKRGGKKYIDKTDKARPDSYTLAMDRIEKDARFDGYYGIQTSEKTMTAEKVTEAYHTLWKIEESFRIMKTTMEVRPVFHWSPKRIHGHFVVCFLAFLMERRLEVMLKSAADSVVSSPCKIQESLNAMQLASVAANGEELLIKAKTDPLAKKIFKTLKISMPNTINRKQDLISSFLSSISRSPNLVPEADADTTQLSLL